MKSVEDHGYILNLGTSDMSGFLSFKDAEKGLYPSGSKLQVGGILDVVVSKVAGNGRTCNVSVDAAKISSSAVSYTFFEINIRTYPQLN